MVTELQAEIDGFDLQAYDRLFLDLIALQQRAEIMNRQTMVDVLDELRVGLIETAPGGWNVQDALGVTTKDDG